MPTIAQAQPVTNGHDESLDHYVLTAPEHGAGYFYAQTAPGTALTLFAFAITLGLLSMVNSEILSLAALPVVVPVAFTLGGTAIFVGGLWDFRAGNMFGGIVGVAYAMFYFSFALMLQFFAAPLVTAAGAGAFGDALGAYLLIWALVTAALCVSAAFVGKMVLAALVVLTAVFLALGFANTGGSTDLGHIGGYLGLLDAAIALYLATAILANTTAAREILPIR
jgi:succinate-acetate transporter protein